MISKITIRCLKCEADLNWAEGSDLRPPRDGDISVCMRCKSLAIFDTSQESGLRPMTDEEISKVPAGLAIAAGIKSRVREIWGD